MFCGCKIFLIVIKMAKTVHRKKTRVHKNTRVHRKTRIQRKGRKTRKGGAPKQIFLVATNSPFTNFNDKNDCLLIRGDDASLIKANDFTRRHHFLDFTTIHNLIFEFAVHQTSMDSLNLYIVVSPEIMAQILSASNITDTRDVIPIKFNRFGQIEVSVPVALPTVQPMQRVYSQDEKRQILTSLREKIAINSPMSEMMNGTAVIPQPGRIIAMRVQSYDAVAINIGLSVPARSFIDANPIWFIDTDTIKTPERTFKENALSIVSENPKVTWEYLDNISLQANNATVRLPANEIFAFLQANTVDGYVQNQNGLFSLLDLDKQMKMKIKKANVSNINLALSETSTPVAQGMRERIYEYLQGARPTRPLPPLVKRPVPTGLVKRPVPTGIDPRSADEVMLVSNTVESLPEIEGRKVYVLKSEYPESIMVASALAGDEEIYNFGDLTAFLRTEDAKNAVVVLSPRVMNELLKNIGIPQTPVAKVLLGRF
jgi:hypothetical protein